jgi:asparagine synthase (glutamine-hydrolysing)
VVLGHRRLSIVDLAGGTQPMSNEDGTIWVSFNGEIYNQAELRGELEGKGHRFATTCDTEVLVHGWEEWGERLPGRLNGIFTFAIADAGNGEVVLVRDPVGVKPLYVGVSSGRTWWASELGAARAAGLVGDTIDADALKLFLTFRFIPSPHTIFEKAWKLPPGHLTRIRSADAGNPPVLRPYDCEIRSPAEPKTRDDWREALLEELELAVERQLMADVPVASLLSGGVDSSLVTLLMNERLPYRPESFGIGFRSDGDESEALAAAAAARDLGVPHHSLLVEDDAYIRAWPEAVGHIAEPIANSGGLLVRLLCEQVSAKHKVVLTGQGADEPLGGYPRHAAERLRPFGEVLPGASVRVLRLLLSHENADRLQRILAAPDRIGRYVQIFSVLPAEHVDELVEGGSAGAEELARAAVERWADPDDTVDSVNDLLRIDARLSLADDLLLIADHFSMQSSVELRVPFLDLRFLELVERMPSRYKLSRLGDRKWLYRQAATARLPESLRRRLHRPNARFGRKRGFSTPLDSWFLAPGGPLTSSESWRSRLAEIPALSQPALDASLSRNGAFARQRSSFYSLAMWVEGVA